uniref:Cytochrome c oxidase subunit 3 n=1 Tax=Tetrodontophora bielanensis TaxID=48717 RepID=Q9B512_TETBI|nr:cytochrome c oxidase subunit III [Tetrodontophora bielanensis]AAK30945.2 cytochrome oxidase subunit 3 [Tetrodontophora bielanensis]
MMIKSNHSFHMVDQSPWPLSAAIGAIIMTSGMTSWFHTLNPMMFMTGMITLLLTTYQWWRGVSRESTFQGLHTIMVIKGMRWGMILFIVSEILFFFSFFWAFFHSSLSPINEIGLIWPPEGIIPFNPIQVPLLNTIILLSSGVSVTWAHHSMMEKNYTQSLQGIIITVVLGIYFTTLQALEYMEASFTISDSAYGSTFFIATGFHGLHVIIGTSFLMVCLMRHYFNHFSPYHHFGFEAAAWYWHFVDVVWLFLYMSIYWWGA